METASAYFGEPILKAAYYIEDAFNKTREEVAEFFAACVEDIFKNIPPRALAPETLRNLADRGCIIHLITHRDTKYRATTEQWLQRHGIPYDSLTMSSNGRGYSKKERCQELGVQFFVDDKLENAEEVASSGIYTLLFHASHNAHRSSNLTSVRSWQEVGQHIDFFLAQQYRQAR